MKWTEFLATTLILPATPLLLAWLVLIILRIPAPLTRICTSGGVLIYAIFVMIASYWRVIDYLVANPLVGSLAVWQ